MKKLSMQELNRLSTEEFIRSEKLPVTVVLDNIRSLNNIGSVFRTSDAFRIECIHLCGITACPPHREIHKTALGATESVSWKFYPERRSPRRPRLPRKSPPKKMTRQNRRMRRPKPATENLQKMPENRNIGRTGSGVSTDTTRPIRRIHPAP